ncbi:hypothetical protein GCM10007047_19870 [Cerasicoccus arenae]|uniref:Cobalamin biosynthesis protein CbiX n=1 Tax=Cerasicoccus arenae TaxID=424488 RepID=A0A8J3DG73_9BACT|nr:hypothetical protein GCM10007047_19870 [Cerasicoccus arenae]
MTELSLLLVDNGSLRPNATLTLRRVAENLTSRLGRLVEPVSVLHSSKVPPALLDEMPAETLVPALRRRLHAGQRHFRLLPFFFGPSRALTDYIPGKITVLRAENPDWRDLNVEIAAPLFDLANPDDRLARALAERVDSVIARRQLHQPAVALVDHGSPEPAVNQVRNAVGEQLRGLLGGRVSVISVASMERREGAEYDFNEPLLERLLRQPDLTGPVIVALMFLSAGRHAGDGGDIAEICAKAESNANGLACHRTETLGEHPLIEEILAERAMVS